MKYSAMCVFNRGMTQLVCVRKWLSWAGHERSALIGQIRSLVSCGTKHSWSLARPSIATEIFFVVLKQGYSAESDIDVGRVVRTTGHSIQWRFCAQFM